MQSNLLSKLRHNALLAAVAVALPLLACAEEASSGEATEAVEEAASEEGRAIFGTLEVAETVASNGLVTGTTGASAQQAGIDMLKAGGTAADAIVATAMNQICLAAGSWVSYAGLMNVVYYEASSGKIYNMNASYDTVEGETDAASIPAPDFSQGLKGVALEPNGRNVLVPGFLKGAEALVQRFGKLKLSDVVAPSVKCATEGFTVQQGLVDQLAFRKDVLSRDPDTKAVFFKADGTAYAAGDVFTQPALATTLDEFGTKGSGYIYKGPWAEKLVAKTQALGGKLSMKDMETYEVIWSEPVHANYHGYDVYVHGLPAAGGVNTIEALRFADLAGMAKRPFYGESAESLYMMSNITRPAIPLTYGGAAMGASLQLDLSLQGRLNPETTAKLWAIIEGGNFPGITPPKTVPAHSDGVVVVDKDGNMAAMVHSINTVSFGTNGLNIDGISIPDSAAIQVSAVAATVPGERLPDPTNPGLVMKDGKPYLGFASIGAGLHQRTTAALVSVLDFGMSPQQAIDAPAFGFTDFSKGGMGGAQTMGKGELSPEMIAEVAELGMEIKEEDSTRGYWIGIMIDPQTGELRGGGPREFALTMGGRAVGY
jgi:gamma-glutamyltranspeptidase/glutathione hydrolase